MKTEKEGRKEEEEAEEEEEEEGEEEEEEKEEEEEEDKQKNEIGGRRRKNALGCGHWMPSSKVWVKEMERGIAALPHLPGRREDDGEEVRDGHGHENQVGRGPHVLLAQHDYDQDVGQEGHGLEETKNG